MVCIMVAPPTEARTQEVLNDITLRADDPWGTFVGNALGNGLGNVWGTSRGTHWGRWDRADGRVGKERKLAEVLAADADHERP